MNQKYKFRGGIRVGLWSNSWPNGLLEVDSDSLILRDEMVKKEYIFKKGEVTKVELIRVFPIIGYGIRIYHNKPEYNPRIYFWYYSFGFKKLTDALKEYNWI